MQPVNAGYDLSNRTGYVVLGEIVVIDESFKDALLEAFSEQEAEVLAVQGLIAFETRTCRW
jgi:hypothetical protein